MVSAKVPFGCSGRNRILIGLARFPTGLWVPVRSTRWLPASPTCRETLVGKRFHAEYFLDGAYDETHGCDYLLARPRPPSHSLRLHTN
jgi:hypothetical protein